MRCTSMFADYPPPTLESIAAARRAQLQERAEVERLAGVRIRDDGRIQMPVPLRLVTREAIDVR